MEKLLMLVLVTLVGSAYSRFFWGTQDKDQEHSCSKADVFLPALDPASPSIKLGFIISKDNKEHYRLKIPGAMTYAVDVVNKEEILPEGYKLQFKVRYPEDREDDIISATLDLASEGVHGIIGPGRQCSAVASLTHSFNLPLLSYSCRERYAANFKNFVSLIPTNYQLIQAMATVIQRSQWKHVTIINTMDFESSANDLIQILESMENDIDHRFIGITKYTVKERWYGNDMIDYWNIVKNDIKKSSVYVLLSKWQSVEYLWKTLGRAKNVFKKRDVTLLFGDNEEVDDTSLWRYTNSRSQRVRFSRDMSDLARLLVVGSPIARSTHSRQFVEKVREKNNEEPFCLKKVFKLKRHVPIDVSSALFDSVMLYAKSVRDVYLSNKKSSRDNHVTVESVAKDGGSLARHVTNTTYTSVLGDQVYLNEDRTRSGYYKLFTLQSSSKCGGKLSEDNLPFCLTSLGYVKKYGDK